MSIGSTAEPRNKRKRSTSIACLLCACALLATASGAIAQPQPGPGQAANNQVANNQNLNNQVAANDAYLLEVLGNLPLTDRVAPTSPPTQLVAALGNPSVQVGGSINWSESVTQASLGGGLAEAGDQAGSALLVFDFTLDGVDDLVLGAPFEDIGNVANAGAFTLVPGDVRSFQTQATNNDPTPVETYSQSGPIPGTAETDDLFGASLAGGDFNGDGFPELVVGAPGEGIGALAGAGTITLLPLSQFEPGFDSSSALSWSQNSAGVAGTAEADDRFAEALAVGDFNGDGKHDLAIGAPGEDIGKLVDAGGIHVFLGSTSYFDTEGGAFLSASSAGVAGAAETDDRFGQALAAGDFNLDGFTDLAVGIPGEDVGALVDAGAVHIFFGGPTGLRTDNDLLITESTAGVAGGAEAGDQFGAALTAGDFKGQAEFSMDLAVGSPGEDIGSLTDAGAVHVFYGDPAGFTTAGSHYLHQDTAGVDGGAESDDRFGAALAAGSVLSNGVLDPQDDLVIGVPGEDIGSLVDAGALAILRGSATGITTSNDASIHAATSGVAGAAEAGDLLGASVAVGDVSGSFQPAVVAGTPGEAVGTIAQAGGVLALDARQHVTLTSTDQPDDVSGKQIHVLYAIPSDASEGRNMDLGMRVDQNVVNAWFTEQLGDRNLRWDTVNGILDVTTLFLDVPASAIGPGPNDVFTLETTLQSLGFNDPAKLYLVYYEGEGNACGVAVADTIAVIWMASCGGSYPEFRSFPTSSTFLAAHELTHGLGAVPACAPNHANNGHVDDDATDLLYVDFAPDGSALLPDYANLTLDPGNQDYYQHSGQACNDIDVSPYIIGN